MPEGPVAADPVLVGIDAAGVEQLVLVTFTEVPVETQRGGGDVGPAVTNGKVTEVDVAGPLLRLSGYPESASLSDGRSTSRVRRVKGGRRAEGGFVESCLLEMTCDASTRGST